MKLSHIFIDSQIFLRTKSFFNQTMSNTWVTVILITVNISVLNLLRKQVGISLWQQAETDKPLRAKYVDRHKPFQPFSPNVIFYI